MITPIYYKDLGHAQFGWLDARHHFSFGHYYDPERMGFGKLRVINDDVIQAGTGFDTHPHDNMEIITYVRRGAITHKDSQGNVGRTEAGDVQVMSAGTGIRHSEHNLEGIDTNLYQIWIEPNQRNVPPRWDAHEFPKAKSDSALSLLVAGDDSAPLRIHADAKIYAGNLNADSQITHQLDQQGYLLISEGEVELEGIKLKHGDAAQISQQSTVTLHAITDAEVLLIDVGS